MTNDHEITALSADLNNWVATTKLPETYPQFSYSQLKHMFWKRDEKPGLNRCYRKLGKGSYVNIKLFGLWMAGELPEQKESIG
ncbi:hypothetical protein [Vibrio breoganii]|uniref:hypothetical protein n=1 Tax=Vibrio breoganii TaxID=553239 RepID=UPI000C84D64B|nr:hypothetical protein [Vibrio breoganii]PMK33059.1 hypothetical protein BCU03_04645 [Vibrio breoganii]